MLKKIILFAALLICLYPPHAAANDGVDIWTECKQKASESCKEQFLEAHPVFREFNVTAEAISLYLQSADRLSYPAHVDAAYKSEIQEMLLATIDQCLKGERAGIPSKNCQAFSECRFNAHMAAYPQKHNLEGDQPENPEENAAVLTCINKYKENL